MWPLDIKVLDQLGGSCLEIAAGKFKAQCLQLMDLVHDTHQEVVITKHGRPVAQLVAVNQQKPRPVFGRMRGLIESTSDLVGPLPAVWRLGNESQS
ncbi:MAG: type II toxin-antitoxin system prevent-host-death family antitoxin [Spirochaetales bacterium]|nr:MAG: type II toxin-antitoxin system prevent-host-death family antitoxin [Spirochaetales bacterium]